MTDEQTRNNRDETIRDMHYDTSPYAFGGFMDDISGIFADRFDGMQDPYNAFCSAHGINPVRQFDGYDIIDGHLVESPDSIFGIGNQKKRAERKLRKAETKLAHGHTKAATRKTAKAEKILGKIGRGQTALSNAQQNLSNVDATQAALASMPTGQSQIQSGSAGSLDTQIPQSMATQPMSQIGSDMGGGGGGGMSPMSSNTGVESDAPNTSDEPVGKLADIKTMPNVTVSAAKPNIIFIVIIAVIGLLALVYFSKKSRKSR